MDSSLLQFLSHNPLFTGGAALGLTGGLLAWGRKLPEEFGELIKRKTTVSVEIMSGDDLFHWTKIWLASHPYGKRSRNLVASVRNPYSSVKRLTISPAPGIHIFTYKNRWIWFTYHRRELQALNDSGISTQDSFKFTTLGTKPTLIRELLEEIEEFYKTKNRAKTEIYINGRYDWDLLGARDPRSLDNIILKQNQKENIVSDIEEFLQNKDWYHKLGIPYRRGYLLYGPPGTGKTSMVLGLAGHFHMPIYCLSLNDIDDNGLMSLIAEVQERAIILIEDIDCSVDDREVSGKHLTFSGMLNAFDGIQTPEGTMIFMTTNHVDQLDPALIRPGRIDMKIELNHVDYYQAKSFFERFFPGLSGSDTLSDTFGKLYGQGSYTPAQLQELIVGHKNRPMELLDSELLKSRNALAPVDSKNNQRSDQAEILQALESTYEEDYQGQQYYP